MKRYIIAAAVFAALIALAAWLGAAAPGSPSGERPSAVSGTVVHVAASARTVTIRGEDGAETALAFVESTRITDGSGRQASLTDIVPGHVIAAEGEQTGPDTLIPETVVISAKSEDAPVTSCDGVANEAANGSRCGMAVGSRITLSLPAGEYPESGLKLDPKGLLGESADANGTGGRWKRTFVAARKGDVEITVPNAAEGGLPYTLEIRIYEDAR